MPIINSILDNDLYKFTQQKAVLAYRQNVPVEYRFFNRRPEGKFNNDFLHKFKNEIHNLAKLRLLPHETVFLRSHCPYLGQDYIDYLKNYQFDEKEVQPYIEKDELKIVIKGTWEKTILWEVPLMAIISELFFDSLPDVKDSLTIEKQLKKLEVKADILKNCHYSDFGTRRRRSFATQALVVSILRLHPGFIGTSNVHIAQKYYSVPIGTMAHEWIMGISALESLRHANRYAMQIWADIFKGHLGIALPDTFGTKAFFEDFDSSLARIYDGVRHDSGPTDTFTKNVIQFYTELGIPPKTKKIIYSNALDCETALRLNSTFGEQIGVAFGIGTNFTNDYDDATPLNMVIKMTKCNNIPVVKLSDEPSKAVGDKDALRVANWTFNQVSLDATL